jgi:putative transposase
MARPLRLEFAGALYHITARGNAKQEIFLDDDDRTKFLSLLGQEVHQLRWKCYSYCLMDNHYHLVIETPEGNLVSGAKRLHGVYSQWFNRRHGRVGHLFQGRYKSIIVDKEEYLLELCRYVVLNPVRAGIVSQPGDWKWSSYLPTMGLADRPEWLDTELILEHFGPYCAQRRRLYKQFVAEGVNTPSPWNHIRGQIWLGRKTYLEKIEKWIAMDRVEEVPRTQLRPTRPTKTEILGFVADYYGLTLGDLARRSDQNAYRAAVYLLRRVANLNIKAVAREFDVSPSRISRIQGEIERGYLRDSQLPELLKRYKVQD